MKEKYGNVDWSQLKSNKKMTNPLLELKKEIEDEEVD